MSLVGRKVAVVSLGMSCQATFQIREHAKLLADLCGDSTVQISTLPFDALICPPDAASKILRQDIFYPPNADEIVVSEGAHWPDFNVYFWHEFRPGRLDAWFSRQADAAKSYETLRSRYRHLADKFRRLRDVDRLIFVICNTQNNLPLVENLTGTISPVIDLASINQLADQCDAFFGRPCGYLFATYPEWHRGASKRANVAMRELRRDQSDWQGDSRLWEGLFREALADVSLGVA